MIGLHFDDWTRMAWLQLWQVTALAATVAILVRLLGPNRPHLAYVLWLLVILKCLTPPLVSSPTGLFSWTGRLIGPDAPSGIAGANRPSRPPFTKQDSALADQWAQTEEAVRPRQDAGAGASGLSWLRIAAWTWLVGIGALGLAAAVGWLRFLAAIRRRGRVADKDLADLLARVSQRMGVRRRVRLVIVDCPLGPAAFGVVRPTIVLPRVVASQPAKQVEGILAHEIAHVRRGDCLVAIVQVCAQAIWWFHPLVWWANRQLSRERERCCDEEVLSSLRCEPADYAQALLDLLKVRRRLRPVFAMPGARSLEATTSRLQYVMNPATAFRKRTPWYCWMAFLAGGLVALPGARPAHAVSAEEPKSDLDRLQGVWLCIAAEDDGKKAKDEEVREAKLELVIQRDHFEMRSRGETIFEGRLAIDPVQEPKTLDMSVVKPERLAGKRLGIYELDAEELKLCSGKQRPREFKTHSKADEKLHVFKLVRAGPQADPQDRPRVVAASTQDIPQPANVPAPELMYLAWQIGDHADGKPVPHVLWDREGLIVPEKEAQEILEQVGSFRIHWRQPNETVRPLVLVLRVAEQFQAPIMTRVKRKDGKADAGGTGRNRVTAGLALSCAAPATLDKWPERITLDIRYPIEERQLIRTIAEIPEEPIHLAPGVQWYIDPTLGWIVDQKTGRRQSAGVPAAVLELIRDGSLDLDRVYTANTFVRGREEPIREAYATIRERDGAKYEIRVSDSIGDRSSVQKVEFWRQRRSTARIEDVPLRLDLLDK